MFPLMHCQILLSSTVLFYSVVALPTQAPTVADVSSQPWYKAWYKEEIESDLQNLGFNASWCAEWYTHIPESHKEDYQYAMEVGELCDRLSENQADHYEAEKEYQSDLKKRKRLRDSLVEIIVKLANSENSKIDLLTARNFPTFDKDDNCYTTAYKTFSEVCVDPALDPNVKKYRRIFANACVQDWLDIETITEQIKRTCEEADLD